METRIAIFFRWLAIIFYGRVFSGKRYAIVYKLDNRSGFNHLTHSYAVQAIRLFATIRG